VTTIDDDGLLAPRTGHRRTAEQTPDNPEKSSMQKISIAFLAAISLASFGCPNKKASSSDVIARMVELKDKMCACKDKACTEKVTEELTRWGQEQAKATGDKVVNLSEDERKKSATVSEEMSKCMAKVVTEAAAAAGGAAAGGGSAAAGGGAAAGPADGSAAPAAGSAGGAAAGTGAAAGSADGAAAAGSAH
jgi:hypothetical protein